jgi:hypothetical protein
MSRPVHSLIISTLAALLAGCTSIKQPSPTQPPETINYQCTATTCTCHGDRDCLTMGADHVCAPGTFSQGSCTAKTKAQ